MDEPELFIITISCPEENFETDMEIPSELPIVEIRSKILEILRSMYEGKFLKGFDCKLSYRNRFLKDEETLLSAGIFDGSKISLIIN